jgi:hypothetical protein
MAMVFKQGEEHMTKEEAWLVWIRATKTSNLPVETDFDTIKQTSWWAAFEAGWNAASKEKDGLIKLLKEEVGFAERGYTKRG